MPSFELVGVVFTAEVVFLAIYNPLINSENTLFAGYL